jgi:hypothetical protein
MKGKRLRNTARAFSLAKHGRASGMRFARSILRPYRIADGSANRIAPAIR